MLASGLLRCSGVVGRSELRLGLLLLWRLRLLMLLGVLALTCSAELPCVLLLRLRLLAELIAHSGSALGRLLLLRRWRLMAELLLGRRRLSRLLLLLGSCELLLGCSGCRCVLL